MTWLARTPEPELMDDPAQAAAYSQADFAAAHDGLVDAVSDRLGELVGQAVDVGCGPADVTVRLARRFAGLRLVGVDGAPAMLELGRRRVARAGLVARVRLEHRVLPDPDLRALGPVPVVLSNSLLHHLHDPSVLWDAVEALAAPGAAVAVTDLRRPPDVATLEGLVAGAAATEPEVLVRDFRASLHAAFTPDEVRAQLDGTPLGHLEVEALGDRHLIAWGRR